MFSPAFHLRSAIFLLGILLVILALFMCLPIGVGICFGAPVENFVFACLATLFIGGLLVLAYKPDNAPQLQVKTAFFFTTLAWIVLTLFSALPFLFSHKTFTLTTSVFEAISALTTTGLSSFTNITQAPVTLIVWRALLQWLGGIGIAIMALTLFPFLGVGGMQLFATESAHHYDKILPKVSQIAKFLLSLYTTMTVLCITSLLLCDMPFLKAFCYGISTVSTSGASFIDSNANDLGSTGVMMTMMFFMILSASPLLLLVRVFQGNAALYTQDSQITAYFKTTFFAALFLTISIWLMTAHSLFSSLLNGCFQAVSMLTTSGFQTEELAHLHPFVSLVGLMLCTVGGCTGSTAGGIKIFRFQLIYRTIRSQVYKMILPHGVFTPIFNKKSVNAQAIYAVLALITIYIMSFCVLSLLFIYADMPVLNALELSINTISNCGAHSFDLDIRTLSASTKWLMSAGMLLGRLEFLTVLILFVPAFWRR